MFRIFLKKTAYPADPNRRADVTPRLRIFAARWTSRDHLESRGLAGTQRHGDALALLTHHMRDVPFAFRTYVLEQIRIEHDGLFHHDRPGLGICFWIVDRHF